MRSSNRFVALAFVVFTSWYGSQFHGKKTASGERFNMFGMTAAHRTLPLGSFIKVIHAKTRKSVVVKINDRGPYIAGRSLDLSLGAANELGILHEGVAPVIIEKVKNEKKMGRLNN